MPPEGLAGKCGDPASLTFSYDVHPTGSLLYCAGRPGLRCWLAALRFTLQLVFLWRFRMGVLGAKRLFFSAGVGPGSPAERRHPRLPGRVRPQAERQHPEGPVPVDEDAVATLAQDSHFVCDDRAHADEHAIEIQLPFLQRLWPQRTPPIVPLLVPALSPVTAAGAAVALKAVRGPDDLLLVSTDLTHYGSDFGYRPFAELAPGSPDLPLALEQLDAGAILKILAADAAGLRSYGQETGITMCGLAATALALDCGVPPAYEAALLSYSRSGDRDGDYTTSVSYAAALLCSGGAND